LQLNLKHWKNFVLQLILGESHKFSICVYLIRRTNAHYWLMTLNVQINGMKQNNNKNNKNSNSNTKSNKHYNIRATCNPNINFL